VAAGHEGPPSRTAPRRVVVIGGGITGLTTAHRLLSTARQKGAPPFAVTLLEERARLGGNIQTERSGGFVIDGGPDSFVIARPHATALCRELGLGDRLISTTERNRRVLVRHGGVLHPLPEGVVLTIPTRVLPLVKSKLFSWPGKARMGLDLLLRRGSAADPSIGEFIRRRLGQEALDRLAAPLLGGIYAGDVDGLSLRSTFPQLLEMEQKYGSLIRGALAQRAALAHGRAQGGPPASPFHSLLGGMGELIDALAASIEKAGGDLRLGARVEAIGRAPSAQNGSSGSSSRLAVRVATAGGSESLEADEVVVTTPAYVAADALAELDGELAAELRRIPYVSTATIALGYARADVPHALDAVGLIIARGEPRRALAATFISSKWVGRAPEGTVLLRIFVGGHRDPAAVALGDDDLVTLAREELGALLGVRARPITARVFRFERSNPQPVVGHGERVRTLRGIASRHPGLHLAGAAFDGVGIPDCVRQAGDVAARIVARSA
jgi:protoporphyrinogen/coproporphyrinogen III oxidase